MATVSDKPTLLTLSPEIIAEICNYTPVSELRLTCKSLYRSALYTFGKDLGQRLRIASFNTTEDALTVLLQISAIPMLRDQMRAICISSGRLYKHETVYHSYVALELGEIWREQLEFETYNDDLRALVEIFRNLKDARNLKSVNIGSQEVFPKGSETWGIASMTRDVSWLYEWEDDGGYRVSDAPTSSRPYTMPLRAIRKSGLSGKLVKIGLQAPRPDGKSAFNKAAVEKRTWNKLIKAFPKNNDIGLGIRDQARDDDAASTEWFCQLLRSATSVVDLLVSTHLPGGGWCHNCIKLSRALAGTFYPMLSVLRLRDVVVEKPHLGKFLKHQRETLKRISLASVRLVCGSWRKLFPQLLDISNLNFIAMMDVKQKMKDPPTGYSEDSVTHILVMGNEEVQTFLRELTSSWSVGGKRWKGYFSVWFPIVPDVSFPLLWYMKDHEVEI